MAKAFLYDGPFHQKIIKTDGHPRTLHLPLHRTGPGYGPSFLNDITVPIENAIIEVQYALQYVDGRDIGHYVHIDRPYPVVEGVL